MTHNQFSGGLETANLVVTSDPVHQAWSAIEKQKQINPNAEQSLCNVFKESNLTIIAFGTPLGSIQGQECLVSSSTLKTNSFTDFEFLHNKSNESFSINQAAIKLFRSNYDELKQKKTELIELSSESSLIIITGQSMGGTVATLFTLWLLKELDSSKTKRPLCITFGSPLVGDEHLRQCVLPYTTWKSCFLHVVSNQVPARNLFVSQNRSSAYKPFGSFLLCSSSGCACSEDPNLILDQLMTFNLQNGQNQDPNCEWHYGQILEELKRKASCNSSTEFIERETDPLQASIITQLLAIEVLTQQQPQPSKEVKNLIGRMKKHETELLIQKKKNSGSDKKLNKMKTCLALFEWYKKESNTLGIGYYDMYKKQCNPTDVNVNEYKKRLWNFWEDSVTKVENNPQMEGAFFKVRWLWAGTNYRRMVEPLHIAEFYKKSGARNYKNGGERPKHFILLEKWLKQQEATGKPRPKRQVFATSTEDSCFWAEVEEVIILCNLLKNGESISDAEKVTYQQELEKFEDYAWDAIDNRTVCPEIFLEKGTFMRWWKEYKGIVGRSYSSELANYMNSRTYLKYI